MPSLTAKRKCPELLFVAPRFAIYRAVSRQINGILSLHFAHLAALSGRGRFGCNHPIAGSRIRDGHREGAEGRDPSRDWSHSTSRGVPQQFSWPSWPQTSTSRTACCHHADNGTWFRGGSPGGEIPRRRTGHCRQDERAWHLHRAGSPDDRPGKPGPGAKVGPRAPTCASQVVSPAKRRTRLGSSWHVQAREAALVVMLVQFRPLDRQPVWFENAANVVGMREQFAGCLDGGISRSRRARLRQPTRLCKGHMPHRFHGSLGCSYY